MGNPRSVVTAEMSALLEIFGDFDTCDSLVQRGIPDSCASNTSDAGLSLARGFQTKPGRTGARKNALKNRLALQRPSNTTLLF